MRSIKLVLLLLALGLLAVVRGPAPDANFDRRVWRIDLLPGLDAAGVARRIGPFELVGAWQFVSHHRDFGNFSALGQTGDGRMVAVGDKDGLMWFTRPDRPGPWHAKIAQPFTGDWRRTPIYGDAEALSVDPHDGSLLLAYEGVPAMFRFRADLTHPQRIDIPALGAFQPNQGPEAMAQLADGRTAIFIEEYAGTFDRRSHVGLLFPSAPRPGEQPARFTVEMPEGYRPTELAVLPDRRVLVLGRTFGLTGFRSVIGLVDPAAIRAGATVTVREIARITDPRIAENYEGMAVTSEPDGGYAVWLVSDSNEMDWAQRTLMLKLRPVSGKAP